MNTNLFKFSTLLLCFLFSSAHSSDIDFSGFHKVDYDIAKNTLPYLKDYQSGKNKMIVQAQKNKMGKNFVNELENNLLLLLASNDRTRKSIFKSFTYKALSEKKISKKEKKVIDSAFASILKHDLKRAKNQVKLLGRNAKTDMGKGLFKELKTILNSAPDESTDSPSTNSTSGQLGGAAAGVVVGGIAGGIASGGNPAGVGAGAVIGGAIGAWLGELFTGSGSTTTTTTTTTHPDGTSTTTTTTEEGGVWLGPNGSDAENCDGPPDLRC